MLADIYFGLYDLPLDMKKNLKNIDKALECYQKAGEGGSYDAYHQIGEIFANGIEVEKNEKKALEAYFVAAKFGYQPSQEILSKAYEEGLLGLAKDLEQAQYWISQAQQGNGASLLD
jgi:uncharacterized protein